ncbi:hypothetical protein ACFQE5_08780 [Pseudonocardia hispaniensis]|uniref:Uncharacterized protein n=1 Tax=Pseudonocardia hispaniensis TaxID=904933 RepID=A0ABW1J0L7_9PSEU
MTASNQSRTAGADVPAKVSAALAECDAQHRQAARMPEGTPAEHAARAARLALVCARRAGWWRVLERWAYLDGGLHVVHGRAARAARGAEQQRARFWRDTARDWRARAAGDPRGSGMWAMGDRLDVPGVA